jgi:hypothetical protein
MIYFRGRDYQDIINTADRVFDLVLHTYRIYHLDAKTMLAMEDIQAEIVSRMVDDFLYIDTSNPCIQEMAERVGEEDWTDEDNDEWEKLAHDVYIAMKLIIKQKIDNYTASC